METTKTVQSLVEGAQWLVEQVSEWAPDSVGSGSTGENEHDARALILALADQFGCSLDDLAKINALLEAK